MPDPATPGRPLMIFDGDCAFCTSSAQWVAERLREPGQPEAELRPWQFTQLDTLGVDPERVRREVVWIAADDRQFGGADAFAQWLQFRGGAYGLVGRMMMQVPVRPVARAVYRLVARNRQRLPGGSPACALPPPGSHHS